MVLYLCHPKAQIQKADVRDNDLFFLSVLLYLLSLRNKLEKIKL